MLGEITLKAGEDHDEALRGQMLSGIASERSDDGVRGFAEVRIGNIDFAQQAWSPETDARTFTLSAGADHRFSTNWRWGGALSLTSQDMDAGTLKADGTAVNGSLFLAYDMAHGYIAATASAGNNSFDLDRHIQLGTMDRVETGNTDASRMALSLGGAWLFGGDNFRHGPFADITWQQIEVDEFQEDNNDSTAMTFDGYDRDSLIGRLGYTVRATAGKIRPYGHVAYNAESEDDQVFVRAGLVTMNGNFVMPAYQPSDNWWTAELGVAFEVSDTLSAHVAYNGLFADDAQDRDTLILGVRKDFGGRDAIVEPVASEPAPDCSSMDDDGDGVNNCNDACPGSAAGEAIGTDGCPVPAEPEPMPEPKAFRNP
jgi:outer membrane lipase/esterase